jgi:hypothetical protein
MGSLRWDRGAADVKGDGAPLHSTPFRMTPADQREVALLALAAVAAWQLAAYFPRRVVLADLLLGGAVFLLLHGLLRDLGRLRGERTAKRTVARPAVRCVCVESTLGVGVIVAGSVLLFAWTPIISEDRPRTPDPASLAPPPTSSTSPRGWSWSSSPTPRTSPSAEPSTRLSPLAATTRFDSPSPCLITSGHPAAQLLDRDAWNTAGSRGRLSAKAQSIDKGPAPTIAIRPRRNSTRTVNSSERLPVGEEPILQVNEEQSPE